MKDCLWKWLCKQIIVLNHLRLPLQSNEYLIVRQFDSITNKVVYVAGIYNILGKRFSFGIPSQRKPMNMKNISNHYFS